jgi:hypothetical protein
MEGTVTMANLLIGSIATAGFLFLLSYVRSKRLKLAWWGWLVIILGFLYGVFVLEVIAAFVEEGSARAAVVMGSVLGFVAVLWGVFLGRFVIGRAKQFDAQE